MREKAGEFGGRGRPRPTVGLLVDILDGSYESAVWSGVVDSAQAHGANLLCFVGGDLGQENGVGIWRNALYDLAGAENVDGLVIMSGAIGNLVGPKVMAEFCRRYHPLPLVSLAMQLEGASNLLVDNTSGMREMLTHLLEQHGYRRIAFIRGPETNEEAEQRFRVYREMLAAHGLPFDPNLVEPGNFTWEAGRDGIQRLLVRCGGDLEAVVVVDDETALGVLDTLRDRGVSVPDDLAVVGFDDQPGAEFSRPPLTTVRQPLYEQGHRAVELMLAHLAGETVPPQVVLPTQLVIRRSCGCLPETALQSLEVKQSGPDTGESAWEAVFAAHWEQILAEFGGALSTVGNVRSETGEQLLTAFRDELKGERPGSFLSRLDRLLRDGVGDERRVLACERALVALRRQVLPIVVNSPEARVRAGNIWQAAWALIAEAVRQSQAYKHLLLSKRLETLRGINAGLITTFDVPGLTELLVRRLPELQIQSCFLSLYEAGTPPRQQARLVTAYNQTGQLEISPATSGFSSRQLAPPEVWPEGRAYAYVVEPLFFRQEHFGFVLFEINQRAAEIYDQLSIQVGSALKGARLVQELEQAYQSLKANQEKLLLAEKMASLGRLTAGIAHEMNTPLAAVRAALSELAQLVEEYQSSVEDASIEPEDHRSIAQEMRRAVRSADHAAERVAGFVSGVKAQTQNLSPHAKQRFEAALIIQEVLALLGYALTQRHCTATLELGDEVPALYGAPGRLAQIVTNLVTNAIDANQGKGGGSIRLRLSPQGEGVQLQVQDEGSGIPPEVLPKIFDPLFTTKPLDEGTGLGLAIVHEIVVGEFGGTIEVDTQVGQGTTFTVYFPLPANSVSDRLR